MQFVISKLVTATLAPANWLLVLLLIFLLIRSARWKRMAGMSALVLAIVLTNPYLYRQAALGWQTSPVADTGHFTAAILPGGVAGFDRQNRGFFGPAADRFIQTALLFHQRRVQYIIVTGGNGHLNRNIPPEAYFLKAELVKMGIPAANIITEAESRNTRQNAEFTKRIIDSMKLQGPFALVTSAMHMRRCSSEFQHAGIPTSPVPANYDLVNGRVNWQDLVWPDFSLPDRWGRMIKEWVGWLVSTW